MDEENPADLFSELEDSVYDSPPQYSVRPNDYPKTEPQTTELAMARL